MIGKTNALKNGGKPEQTKTVEFNPGSANNITIAPDAGYVLSSVQVNKPTTMIPNNIKKDVNIGGVVGTFEGNPKPEQSKMLDFNPGSAKSIKITPDEGYVLSDVIVGKPKTMIPGNIKKGVDIGGVIGTYEGSTVSKGLIFKNYNSSGYPTVASFEGGWTDIPEAMCSGVFKSDNYFKNIKSLEIPNGVNRLGKSAFNSCDSLTSITLPNSLTYIDYFAFNGCTNLTNLTIPINVNTIKNSALSCGSSENKTTFTFKSTTPPSIGSQVFNTSWINKIYVPSSAVSAYKSANNWSSLSAYIQADPNE